MARDHASPEERLLALIRGKQKRPEPEAKEKDQREAAAAKAPETKHEARRPRGVRVREILKTGFFGSGFLEPASIKTVNRFMAVLAVLFIVYIFIDIIFVKPEKTAAVPAAKGPGPGRPAAGGERRQAPDIKDYSYYSAQIGQKNIFGQAEQDNSQAQAIITAEDLAGNIGLVGIIAGDNPQAVIEDKKSQKTYYMTKGESFNGFIVEEISRSRVVLDYQGKKIALSL